MWGLPLAPLGAWPTPTAPELAVLKRAPTHLPLIALFGAGAVVPLGRYGIVGVPGRITVIEPHPRALKAAFDSGPTDCLRIIALGYELGATTLWLNERRPPAGQPFGVCIDLAAALISDHATCTLSGYRDYGALWEAAMSGLEIGPPPALTLAPAVTDLVHAKRVCACQEHIARGDIYQASVTRRLDVRGVSDPARLAIALQQHNPVAHGAYLRLDEVELISNSMETLLTYEPETRELASYPIKGTRAEHALAELCRDPKERAEHVMIVDLVRHDLGRVCIPGSISVPELMGAYQYRGVCHGVSTVRGTLAPDRTIGDAVAAIFPGGSITGAPKRRAVQIIRELEGEPRGFYTGSLALVAPSGRLSMSILIRTLVKEQRGWSLGVGGGIVADSDPAREIEETWEKVAVFGKPRARFGWVERSEPRETAADLRGPD